MGHDGVLIEDGVNGNLLIAAKIEKLEVIIEKAKRKNLADIELFGKRKLPWLKTFLNLPNEIPSHNIFGRVFAKTAAQQSQLLFYEWIWAVKDIIVGKISIEMVNFCVTRMTNV